MRPRVDGQPRNLELGEFLLEAPIGKGGMASVWRGVHRVEKTAVAIKLVTADPDKHRSFRSALQNEVRAMARLDHPGIAAVLDHGQVSESEALASNGALVRGSPYLVMELADGGTLRREHVQRWPDLRATLVSLLTALGHAHARGVIHRDLKPSNVLVDGPFHTLRLTDFGIAHALSRAGASSPDGPISAGTAWFMAPEQILGLNREEGPWTDLYALGCLTYLLACRRAPFPGKDREYVYRSHCLTPMPPLKPVFEVPAELEPWILVLTAKRARDRFELAADALAALSRIGGATLAPAAHEDSALASELMLTPASSAHVETRTDIGATTHIDAMLSGLDPAQPIGERESALRAHSVPEISSEPLEPIRAHTHRMLGIGLGIFGLRPIPLAGREAERARMWSALANVARSRQPRAIVVRGRAGNGKTRLAEWLAELAAERGAAHVLWVRHDASPASSDPLSRMLERYLRAEGLAGEELEHQIAVAIPELAEAARAQLALLSSSRGGMRREERFAIVRECLLAISRRRPALLVFDDAQYGADAIAFADYLLRLGGSEAPAVLAVLTVREEALDERPAEAADLAALLARRRAEEVYVGPLGTAAHAQLVEDLLGLEPSLAAIVAQRTHGSPLFAVQLVGDWVQQGKLVTGERGFTLRDGAGADIPNDIHALYSARIDRLVESFPLEARAGAETALAIMTLLGRQVVREEWERACHEAGVEAKEALLDAMANRRLAVVGRQRFTLVHKMLHESLERRSRERGGESELHAACARMLEALHGDDPSQAERLGTHLAHAGELERALGPLLAGAETRLLASEFAEARAVCALYASVLDRLGAREDDPRRARAWMVDADVTSTQGLFDEAAQVLGRADAAARANDDGHLLARVLSLRGSLCLKRGAVADAASLFRESIERSRASGDTFSHALSLHGLAEALKLTPRIAESIGHYEEAAELFARLDDGLRYGRCRLGMADVARRLGDLEGSAQVLEDVIERVRALGNRHSEAVAHNTLGDVERARGRLADAERHYSECLRLFGEIASEDTVIPRLNLGLVLLARGQYAKALRLFESTRPELSKKGREPYVSFVIAGCMAAAAGVRDVRTLEAMVAEGESRLPLLGIVDEDIAWPLELAGDLASSEGQAELAARAFALALSQWTSLAREAERERVKAKTDPR
jgi:serine/threonine protein kinase/tetratricopeptide (TPR) repeat protein